MKAKTAAGVVPSPRETAPPRGRVAAPQRDPAFATTELAELRRMRTGLIEEESRVSYWRRILQARMDLIRTRNDTTVPISRLTTVLADARGSHRRVAALSVEPVTDLPPLPDLVDLWDSVDDDDPAAKDELLERLTTAEEHLSEFRRTLHGRIDRVTGELIARYRENPVLALTALNERLGGH